MFPAAPAPVLPVAGAADCGAAVGETGTWFGPPVPVGDGTAVGDWAGLRVGVAVGVGVPVGLWVGFAVCVGVGVPVGVGWAVGEYAGTGPVPAGLYGVFCPAAAGLGRVGRTTQSANTPRNSTVSTNVEVRGRLNRRSDGPSGAGDGVSGLVASGAGDPSAGDSGPGDDDPFRLDPRLTTAPPMTRRCLSRPRR